MKAKKIFYIKERTKTQQARKKSIIISDLGRISCTWVEILKKKKFKRLTFLRPDKMLKIYQRGMYLACPA